MKVFGKEVGKAIKFPPFIKQFKSRILPKSSSGETISSTKISNGEAAFKLSATLPGLDKKTMKVRLQGNTLIISGEKEQSQEVREKHWVRRELIRTTFYRAFDIPLNIDSETINATMNNGLLQVSIAKKEVKYKRNLKVV